MSINGNLYDWEEIDIQAAQGIMVGITEITYSDEKGIEPRYGRGALPRSYGRKNYKGNVSVTLDKDEFERLRVASGGSIYRAKPMPIVVKYGNDEHGIIVDTLPAVKFTKQDTSAKQDDDNAGTVKLDGVVLQPIKWNGVAAY